MRLPRPWCTAHPKDSSCLERSTPIDELPAIIVSTPFVPIYWKWLVTIRPQSNTTGLPPVGRRAYRNGITSSRRRLGSARAHHAQSEPFHAMINKELKGIGKRRVLPTEQTGAPLSDAVPWADLMLREQRLKVACDNVAKGRRLEIFAAAPDGCYSH